MALKFSDIFKPKVGEERLSPDTVKLLSRARSLQKQDQLREAAVAYRSILERDPNHWECLNAVAAIALQSGEFTAAVLAYSAVIERKPDYADAYYRRGNAQNALGRSEAALADYDQAIALDPKLANAFCNRGAVLERLDRLHDAHASYQQAISLNPKDFLSHYNRGSVLTALEKYDDALDSYEQAIALKADHAEAYFNRGNILRQLQRYDAAVVSYDKAIGFSSHDGFRQLAYDARGLVLADLERYVEAIASHDEAIALNSNDHLSHFNRALALKKLRRLEEALASFDESLLRKGDYANAIFYRGQVLQEMGRFAAAIESFDKAIELMSSESVPYPLHSSRGFALGGLGRFDEAVAAFDKAIALNSEYFDAHCARGHALMELRQYEAAAASYDKAIAITPDNPQARLAYAKRGFALTKLKRFREALLSYDQAIALQDTDSEVRINQAGVLQEMGQYKAAIASYGRAIDINPYQAESHAGRGFAMLALSNYEAAMESFDRAHTLNPDMKYLSGFRQYARMQLCDWRDLASYLEGLEQKLMARDPASGPFQVLGLLDSPHLQRLAAETWVREECPPDNSLGAIPSRPRGDKIRIGYFSADFYYHAVSFLTAELYEVHDRSRFEIVAFAFGPKINDAVRARLMRAFDRFVDVSEQSDAEVALTARSMGIDIAVDLGGFTTQAARTRIFALRAAPIQMSYIGYLGTMGAHYMDYLLADATLIPVQEQQHYSEAIIYLPSYQVNDSTRPAVERSLGRDELGLSAAEFVFCCFNANYKILPATFALWMRILNRVKKSSLYLYVGSETAEENLRREAERSGIAPQRLVFGRILPHAKYMARLRSMDLFLDTLPYNAGTTASDALWAGLPVLTCAGRTFAGRMAASLLNAIELPELVTSTIEEYENLAVQLAEHPEMLRKIKLKLSQNRITSPLFNTKLFAKNLELAYSRVHERHHAGQSPETIFVTPDP